MSFRGNYSLSSAEYEAVIEFYADVKPGYRRIPGDRHLELVLDKAAGGWWPRLLKEASKVSFTEGFAQNMNGDTGISVPFVRVHFF